MKRFAQLVIAILSFVPILSAQEMAPPVKEPPAFVQETVPPVNVSPVKEPAVAMISLVVTDSRGNHIPSLRKDDFQLSIGGTPVDLVRFSERGAAGVPAGEMRRIAVLFDATTLSGAGRRQAADALHGFLARTLRPGDMAAILDGGQALRALTGWTSDLKELDAALDLVSGETSTPVANTQAEAEKRIREMATDIQQEGQSGHTFYTFDALIDAARAYAAASYGNAEQTLSVISSTVGLFTPRTRNVLIVIGGGLPRTPGAGVFQYVETIRENAQTGVLGAALQAGANRSSPMGESSSYDLTPLFNAFSVRAWRRGIVLYTVSSDLADDAGSHIDMQQASDRLAAFTNAATRFDGYQMLTEETSGVAFTGRSAADALNRIASDLDSFYSVGVHPMAPISGRLDVAVKVKNGYAVRLTRGSAGLGTPADMMESRVIANQIVKPNDNTLGISLNATDPVIDGERRLVTIDVMIPIRRLKLVPEGNSVTGAFTVFIATGDSVGHSSNVTRQTQEIRWPADAVMRAGDKALTYRVNVVLQPGRSQISVGVMDEKSQEKGFDRLSV